VQHWQQTFVDCSIELLEINFLALFEFLEQFIGFVVGIWEIVELVAIKIFFDSKVVGERCIVHSLSLRFSKLVRVGISEWDLVKLCILF